MATETRNPIDRTCVYVGAGLISSTGALLLNVMPVFFGVLGSRLGYGEQQLGTLALATNLAFAVVGVVSLAWVSRFSWRTIARVATTGMALAIAAVLMNPGYGQLLGLLALAGGCAGALYALAMVIFGCSSQPERAFGFKLGMESAPGALMLLLLPVAVIPQWGFSGVVVALVLGTLLMGLGPLFWVPKGSAQPSRVAAMGSGADQGRYQVIVWLSLGASLIFMMGIMAIWPFLELIGGKTGLSTDQSGVVLSVGFLINAVGGFIASSLGLKAGRIAPVAIVVTVELLGLVLIGQFSSLAAYATGALCFLFSINFVLAYTFGLMAEFDASGKLVALGAVCISVGAALGPAIAGQLIEEVGYGAALIFSAACSVAAVAIHAGLSMRADLLHRQVRQDALLPLP
jgi:MFS family permease